MAVSPKVTVKNSLLATIAAAAGGTVACLVVPQAYKGEVGRANKSFISSLSEFYDTFGPATALNYESWFSAEGYLKHGRTLWVSRAMPAEATYAYIDVPPEGTASAGVSGSALTVGSIGEGIDFDSIGSVSLPDNVALRIYARGPGEYAHEGTEVKVGVIPASAWGTIDPSASGPALCPDYWDVEYGPVGDDELLVIVAIADAAGNETIIEDWLVSTSAGKKTYLDESMYITDRINRHSKYIAVSHNPDLMPTTLSGQSTYYNLSGGFNGTNTVSDAMVQIGYGYYQNELELAIDLFIDGGKSDTVKRYITSLAEAREDSVAILDVPWDQINASDPYSSMIDWSTNTLNINSTYAAIYGNWGQVYDRYNDKYRWVPLAGYVAGAFAFNDLQEGTWFAPAGLTRGILNGLRQLKIYPTRGQMDEFSQARINAIMYGSGISVWGQKTAGTSDSAYSRLNVRRLYTTLNRAIGDLALYYEFEENTRLARSNLVGAISTFLDDIKGNRGIYEYQVICNDINNTPATIDRNELHVDIIIKPAKFVEFAIMRFVEVQDESFFSESLIGGFPAVPGGPGPGGEIPPPVIAPFPPIPQLLTPADGTTGSSAVTFTWTTTPTAGIESFEILCITGWLPWDFIFNETVPGSAFSFDYDLPAMGVTYKWRVRTNAASGDAEHSYPSPYFYYSTYAGPPPPKHEYVIVDTGMGAGYDYPTLRQAVEANSGRDLTTEEKLLIFECRASTSAVDHGGNVVVSGFNPSSEYYVVISAAASAVSSRIYDTADEYSLSGYGLMVSAGKSKGLAIYDDYTQIWGLAVQDDSTSATFDTEHNNGITIYISGARDVVLRDIWSHQAYTSWARDFVVAEDTHNFKAINVWAERFNTNVSSTGSSGAPIKILNDTGTPILYNCTNAQCRAGFFSSGCSAIAKNCLSDCYAPVSDEFVGTWNTTASVLNYSANDTSAPGLSAIHNLGSPDWVDPGAPDYNYHINQNDTKVIFSGADLSLDPIYPFHDANEYQNRMQYRDSWDIGADYADGLKNLYIIDPDNGPGTDYTSLLTWEPGSQRNLTVSKQCITAACRSTNGTYDVFNTTKLRIDGWECNENYNVTISGMEGYRPKAYWQSSGAGAPYTVYHTNTVALESYEDYVTFDGLQIEGYRNGSVIMCRAYQSNYINVKNIFGINKYDGTSSYVILSQLTQVMGKCWVINNIAAGRREYLTYTFDLDPQFAGTEIYTSAYCLNNIAISLSANGGRTWNIYSTVTTTEKSGYKWWIFKNCISEYGTSQMYTQTAVIWAPGNDYCILSELSTPVGGHHTRAMIGMSGHYKDKHNYDFRLSRFDWFATRWGEPNPQSNGTSPPEGNLDIEGKPRINHPNGLGQVERDYWEYGYGPRSSGSTIGAWQPPYDIVYVDTGGTGDYSSLGAWEADRQRDLTAEEVIETVVCMSTDGSPDTSVLNINGWTVNEDYYIYITVDPHHQHKGFRDDTKFRRINYNNTATMTVSEQYTLIEGLQFILSGTTQTIGITFNGGSTNSYYSIIRNCLVDGSETTTVGNTGINTGAIIYCYNNIVYGLSGTSNNAIYIQQVGCIVAHNTVVRNKYGIVCTITSGVTLINNLSVENDVDYLVPTPHGDSTNNMCSYGQTYTGGANHISGTALFNNPAINDYRLKIEAHTTASDYTSAIGNLPRIAGSDVLLSREDHPCDYDIMGKRRYGGISMGAYQSNLRIIRVVDAGGTGDFTYLSNWESSTPAGVTTDIRANSYRSVAECLKTNSNYDLGNCSINGVANPSPWHYYAVSAHPDYRHDGKWDDNKFRMYSPSVDLINLAETHTHIRGLQGEVAGGDPSDIPFDSQQDWCWVDSCIARSHINRTASYTRLFTVTDWSVITNCIASGASGASNTSCGFYTASSKLDPVIMNCLAIRCEYGFFINSAFIRYNKLTHLNNIATECYISGFGNLAGKATPEISWSYIWSNNISTDDTAPLSSTSTTGATPVYIDIETDTRLSASDTVAQGQGINLSNRDVAKHRSILLTTDASGDSRPTSGAWSSGPDEPQ